MNWPEKDKDLLQMIIGGTACNACGICKEVYYATMFCPQHSSHLGVYKNQGQYTNTTTQNSNMNARATQICHFLMVMAVKGNFVSICMHAKYANLSHMDQNSALPIKFPLKLSLLKGSHNLQVRKID